MQVLVRRALNVMSRRCSEQFSTLMKSLWKCSAMDRLVNRQACGWLKFELTGFYNVTRGLLGKYRGRSEEADRYGSISLMPFCIPNSQFKLKRMLRSRHKNRH